MSVNGNKWGLPVFVSFQACMDDRWVGRVMQIVTPESLRVYSCFARGLNRLKLAHTASALIGDLLRQFLSLMPGRLDTAYSAPNEVGPSRNWEHILSSLLWWHTRFWNVLLNTGSSNTRARLSDMRHGLDHKADVHNHPQSGLVRTHMSNLPTASTSHEYDVLYYKGF